MDLVRRCAQRKKSMLETEELVAAVTDLLDLRSLTRGIGVTEAEFASTLRAIQEFAESDVGGEMATKRQRLKRSMRGLPVVVGKYLGLSDSGHVIIPANLPLD